MRADHGREALVTVLAKHTRAARSDKIGKPQARSRALQLKGKQIASQPGLPEQTRMQHAMFSVLLHNLLQQAPQPQAQWRERQLPRRPLQSLAVSGMRPSFCRAARAAKQALLSSTAQQRWQQR